MVVVVRDFFCLLEERPRRVESSDRSSNAGQEGEGSSLKRTRILEQPSEQTAFDLYFLAMAYYRLEDFARADEAFARGQQSERSPPSLPSAQRQELATIRAETQSMLAEKQTAKE